MPSRRLLLAQAAALAGAALTPAAWTSAAARTRTPDDPFRLGVASGEPAPDGMVLWTRLAPQPHDMGAGMTSAPVAVSWEIAEDPQLKRTAARGRAIAVVDAGHSVHVEVAGLKPDREYWYRFTALGHASPIGRTRTAPAAGASVQRLRLAYGSCQKYSAGHYTAHAALAKDDLDLVLFLGDYIYEEAHTGKGPRAHPAAEPLDLAGYRHRYAWYKADLNLQAAHACAPWMVIWDDHEVVNDYGADQDRTNPDPARFLKRRAAAYQAYYENMPLRRTQKPVGPDMLLHRSLAWGDLAAFQFLDTRQHRNRRTCDAVSDGKLIPYDCPERLDPSRSLLGRGQETWLQDALRGSRANWNVLAQQYLLEEVFTAPGKLSNDGWSGYPATRQRLIQAWQDAAVSNPLVLGGDIHCFFAGELAARPGGKPVASEFVGGSISSLGRANSDIHRLVAANPSLKFGDGEQRGYGRVEITPKACRVTFRAVADALVAGSPVTDLARFVVEAGEPGLKTA
ncbi:alkaline phosphatase D family protein [uncultured Phenylobacterium sp.]|uniref:alkaline phosphatase D family protein n=1 Tax=uncultured Phenylobacterium sp. TaxID=349273 RepID=UPI0025E52513|nr:alkaline phosphatase D family protein [uncultured Phenylobacterium sp.]